MVLKIIDVIEQVTVPSRFVILIIQSSSQDIVKLFALPAKVFNSVSLDVKFTPFCCR